MIHPRVIDRHSSLVGKRFQTLGVRFNKGMGSGAVQNQKADGLFPDANGRADTRPALAGKLVDNVGFVQGADFQQVPRVFCRPLIVVKVALMKNHAGVMIFQQHNAGAVIRRNMIHTGEYAVKHLVQVQRLIEHRADTAQVISEDTFFTLTPFGLPSFRQFLRQPVLEFKHPPEYRAGCRANQTRHNPFKRKNRFRGVPQQQQQDHIDRQRKQSHNNRAAQPKTPGGHKHRDHIQWDTHRLYGRVRQFMQQHHQHAVNHQAGSDQRQAYFFTPSLICNRHERIPSSKSTSALAPG